jgi:hypothetical protein
MSEACCTTYGVQIARRYDRRGSLAGRKPFLQFRRFSVEGLRLAPTREKSRTSRNGTMGRGTEGIFGDVGLRG